MKDIFQACNFYIFDIFYYFKTMKQGDLVKLSIDIETSNMIGTIIQLRKKYGTAKNDQVIQCKVMWNQEPKRFLAFRNLDWVAEEFLKVLYEI